MVWAGPHRPGPAVDVRPRVSRVPQDRADGRDGRSAPDDVAKCVASRYEHVMLIEFTDDSGEGPSPKESGEDEVDAVLDFAIGSLDDAPQRVADEAHREGQCQFTALSLVE
jgi:hypothetical protein